MSSGANSAQPTTVVVASDSLSNVLGSIGQSSTDAPSAANSASSQPPASGSGSGSSPASVSASASASGSGSVSATPTTAAASNTITNAPNLTSGQTSSASSLSGAPSLTSNDLPKLTDLPTLSGYYSYPPPTVPPTSGAPYMRKTNLPENFVFIVVGACIAFVALVIILWRTLTAWSINRRFRRGEGVATRGRASYTPLADFKQKPPVASSHDMKDLGSLPRNFSSVPSLFFSPTAEVAKQSMRPPSGMDTSHAHLPAGHYRDASRS